MSYKFRAILIASNAVSALCIGTGPAQAQGSAQAVSGEQSSGLAEIIVTAQRRGENIQNVPISISAFSEDSLAQAGVATVKDLATVDPSLNITGHSGSVLPFLRGIGNPSATTIGNESSVPIYIDDVYYTRVSPAYLELAKVERVEVLKGPQGTLFGRNASGGLIHVITPDPSPAGMLAEATLGYANYNTVTGKFYVSTPLSDDTALDLSVSGRHQGDGWGNNLFDGSDTYKDKFISVRSKLLIDLTPTTQIRLSGFYANQYTTKINLQSIYGGTVSGTPPFFGPSQPVYSAVDVGSNRYNINQDQGVFNKFESWGGALKIKQELGNFADLVSITSYRKTKELWKIDADYTPYPWQTYSLPSIDREITEELQLKSQTGSSVDWIVGGFYLDSHQGYNPITVAGTLPSVIGFDTLSLVGIQNIKSYSGYGQATFHVLPDGTNITLGLRYTSDNVQGIGETGGNIASVGKIVFTSYDKTFNFRKLTYKVAVDHRITSDVMGYVSLSRGYKSGTFNTLPLTTDPSRPEVVDSYEAGLKAQLFGNKLRLNVAIFQNDIKDPQVQTIIVGADGTRFVGLTNAEKARSRGIEVDATALVADGLTFRLGGVLLDAKYTKFTNGPVAERVLDSSGNPTAPYGNLPLVVRDLSGSRMAQVPKVRLTGGINYDISTSAGRFKFDANASYTSEFPWEPDAVVRQQAYVLLGGSLGWSPASMENVSVRIWVKNLTDKVYYDSMLSNPGSEAGNVALMAAPRTFGVEVGYKF